MNFIKYISLVTVFMFQLACQNEDENKTSEDPIAAQTADELRISKAQFKAGGMQLIQLEKQSFNQAVECTGLIDVPPQNKAIISAVMGGYVKNSSLLVGDQVKKGQLLLTIENPEYAEMQQNYLETKATINYLREDFERQQTLQIEKINSTKEFLKAKSDYEQAEAKLQGLAEKLQMLSIDAASITAENLSATIQLYSPINGRVSMVNISRGTYVNPANPLMEIIAIDHLHLELNVYERDYLKIKVGQKIFFSATEASDSQYRGEVHLIGNTIDAQNRTVKVHGHLETDSISFAVGMFIEAEIVIRTDSLLAAPNDAIVKVDNSNALFRLLKETETDYVFEKELVKTGKMGSSKTSILDYDGWSAENKYLLGGYHFVMQEGE